MTIDEKIRDEKLQYHINREAKISASSSGKSDKKEHLAGEEIQPSNKRQIIEKAKFAYSSLGKAFEKEAKAIKDQGIKQGKALKSLKAEEALKALKKEENQELKSIEGLFPKNMRTNKIKNKIDEIRKWEEKIEPKSLKYKTNKCLCDFQQFETIRSFGDSIYTGKINIDEAEIDQRNLLENIVKFSNKSIPKTKESKTKKQNTFDSANVLYEGRELTLNSFRSGIFPIKSTQGKGCHICQLRVLWTYPDRKAFDRTQLKILTPKQMLQRLPMVTAQVKARNTSENLLNEMRQIIYSLYQAKEVAKKVYNNTKNSINL